MNDEWDYVGGKKLRKLVLDVKEPILFLMFSLQFGSSKNSWT